MKTGARYSFIALGVFVMILGLVLAPALLKLDFSQLPARAAWQLPDRVVRSLGVEAGHWVADIGAGDGYFTFRLADAVGPGGRVFATDVDETVLGGLREAVRSHGYSNVEVVRAEANDSGLPDGAIDLVFLCNVYHHIDDRVPYFDALRGKLKPDGRVAIVEPSGRLPLRFFTPPGHWTPLEDLAREMESASYRVVASLDFLPVQELVIFAPRE